MMCVVVESPDVASMSPVMKQVKDMDMAHVCYMLTLSKNSSDSRGVVMALWGDDVGMINWGDLHVQCSHKISIPTSATMLSPACSNAEAQRIADVVEDYFTGLAESCIVNKKKTMTFDDFL